jgi:hypothetical protein
MNDNLETFSLLWLDAFVHKSKENVDAQQRLRSIINHLKIFDDIQQCEEYIRQMSHDDRLVLISSGRLGQELVPRIHQLRHVFSIYVYCMDKVRNEMWAKNFRKVITISVLIFIKYTPLSYRLKL